ncbi:TetR/AcrR family transcriptional regulator [Devosia lacusdianchii]|uniref:TetR/AcrR family transcriptional regulator n=1 Tax=Devosia lacusdianchii TaxID=2917991 RepID=UPI001F0700F8|nr:TetR/AcrR family transcriptional regulator [Devosia sp. JXJ CY 41]
MAATAARKLPKADRREQLLETAHLIAREEGTDALTLGHLAQRAGVSKPIAYEHFVSRSGLMIALYKRINDRQLEILAAALAYTPQKLETVAEVMGQAYMSCYTAVGPEWHAIAAALRGDAQMDAYQQELIDGHIDFYAKALGPMCQLSETDLRRRCVGIIGAAEAISRDMVRGRISKDAAAADLTSLIVDWLR